MEPAESSPRNGDLVRHPIVRKLSRGFSLIELLIVVAIILVLLSMALPRVQDSLRHARELAAIQAIRTIHT
ncbi:MAG: type IV pilin protein, partial [Bryobacteraceae bacterium]